MVQSIEQIAYDAGRSALADQESLVAGIRARTGTLLAAHALVASFLGATTIRANGLTAPVWVAVTALALALIAAAVILSPWRLRFSLDVRGLYNEMQQCQGPKHGAQPWLATVGLFHQSIKEDNEAKVRRMSALSGALAMLMVIQTPAWVAALVA